jgi:hypothetical protein
LMSVASGRLQALEVTLMGWLRQPAQAAESLWQWPRRIPFLNMMHFISNEDLNASRVWVSVDHRSALHRGHCRPT